MIRREAQVQQTTTDQRLLAGKGDTGWVHTDPWRVMRIQAEFVEGFGTLAELGPAVLVDWLQDTVAGDGYIGPGDRELFTLTDDVDEAVAFLATHSRPGAA